MSLMRGKIQAACRMKGAYDAAREEVQTLAVLGRLIINVKKQNVSADKEESVSNETSRSGARLGSDRGCSS